MAGRTADSDPSLLGRAMRVIRALPADGSAAQLSDIARDAQMPRTTAQRIASELTRLGLIERRADGTYVIGTTFWELGERAPVVRVVREAANPELADLYDRTGENAHVAVLVGHEVLFVARATGARAIPTSARVGIRHPFHATGVGRAILAAASDDEAAELLAGPLSQVTPHTTANPRQLAQDRLASAARGYAITRQEMSLGNASIAIALARRPGLPPSAIGVVTHLASADEQRLVPLLRRAVTAIDARLDAALAH